MSDAVLALSEGDFWNWYEEQERARPELADLDAGELIGMWEQDRRKAAAQLTLFEEIAPAQGYGDKYKGPSPWD